MRNGDGHADSSGSGVRILPRPRLPGYGLAVRGFIPPAKPRSLACPQHNLESYRSHLRPEHAMRWPFTRGKRRGQAMIEFAVILPLFILLIGGVVDFGIYMFQREQASSCVRTVARKASVRSEPSAKSLAGAPQCTVAANKGALTLNPDYPNYKTAGAGTNVSASISYQYVPILLGNFVPGLSMPVTATVTMRMEAGA